MFHVHDDEPRPACRREPGHVREEGIGGYAVPVGVRLDGAEGVGQNTLRPPLVDEAGEHVHDGGREVAVRGPARPDVVLLEQHGGVKEFFPLTIHFSGGRSGNLLGVHRLHDPAQNTQLPHSQGFEGFPERRQRIDVQTVAIGKFLRRHGRGEDRLVLPGLQGILRALGGSTLAAGGSPVHVTDRLPVHGGTAAPLAGPFTFCRTLTHHTPS